MMVTGISCMIGTLLVALIFRDIRTTDLMLFCIWIVIAICGAIRRVR